MPRRRAELQTLSLLGLCLLCVQQAEIRIESAVEIILDRPPQSFANESENKRKQTLGELLMRLKRRVKLEHGLKENLFTFLEMRNTLIHDFSTTHGSDLRTEKGREKASLFLLELTHAALATTMLFGTLFSVASKDDYPRGWFLFSLSSSFGISFQARPNRNW